MKEKDKAKVYVVSDGTATGTSVYVGDVRIEGVARVAISDITPGGWVTATITVEGAALGKEWQEEEEKPVAQIAKIVGSEIEYSAEISVSKVEEICLDVWRHPSKYSVFEDGSKDAYYRFLKYLWVRYPDGREERLADVVERATKKNDENIADLASSLVKYFPHCDSRFPHTDCYDYLRTRVGNLFSKSRSEIARMLGDTVDENEIYSIAFLFLAEETPARHLIMNGCGEKTILDMRRVINYAENAVELLSEKVLK